jgi:hypothetical protein
MRPSGPGEHHPPRRAPITGSPSHLSGAGRSRAPRCALAANLAALTGGGLHSHLPRRLCFSYGPPFCQLRAGCAFSVILPPGPRRLRVAVLFHAALFLLYHAGLVGSAGTRSPGHSTTGGGPARPSSLPSDEPTMNQDPRRGVSLLLPVINPGRYPSDAGEYAETEGRGGAR